MMDRDQTTEQQHQRKGVGVFPEGERLTNNGEHPAAQQELRRKVGVFDRPVRTGGLPSSLVVSILVILALIILAVIVF
jgi:hypothetical protein